jgi:hypothetical protein
MFQLDELSSIYRIETSVKNNHEQTLLLSRVGGPTNNITCNNCGFRLADKTYTRVDVSKEAWQFRSINLIPIQ